MAPASPSSSGGPFAVGLPLGSVIGAVVGGVMRGNLTAGAVAGSVFAFGIAAEVCTPGHSAYRAGALPAGRPIRGLDRGRLRSTPSRPVEYEVRRRDRCGKLTLSSAGSSDQASGAARLSDALGQVQSRHLIYPARCWPGGRVRVRGYRSGRRRVAGVDRVGGAPVC